MFMDDLLEDAGEVFADLLLHGSREPSPDVLGLLRHGIPHSFTRESSSPMASKVNFVRRGEGWLAARLVAETGMQRWMESR
jgi:hypothetical protein